MMIKMAWWWWWRRWRQRQMMTMTTKTDDEDNDDDKMSDDDNDDENDKWWRKRQMMTITINMVWWWWWWWCDGRKKSKENEKGYLPKFIKLDIWIWGPWSCTGLLWNLRKNSWKWNPIVRDEEVLRMLDPGYSVLGSKYRQTSLAFYLSSWLPSFKTSRKGHKPLNLNISRQFPVIAHYVI